MISVCETKIYNDGTVDAVAYETNEAVEAIAETFEGHDFYKDIFPNMTIAERFKYRAIKRGL
jgi:hypothetical protein